MNKIIAELFREPTLRDVAALRHRLAAFLEHRPLPQQIKQNFILATSEIITNIIKHAKQKPHYVAIQMQETRESLTLCIKDNGSAFSDFSSKLASSKITQDRLQTSGMGLYLVGHLFPHLNYQVSQHPISNCFSLPYFYHQPSPFPIIIAIVEDSPSQQHLLQSYLQENYTVKLYASAQALLDDLPHQHIDLIISDITMPETDGITLRNKLADSTNNDLIPFIFLTSQTDTEIRQVATSLGIADYLVKPISKQQLQHVITRVMIREQHLRERLTAAIDQSVTSLFKPSLPNNIVNYQTRLYTRSATAGGGDFVFFSQKNDKSLLILADVMGHGTKAKFFVHSYAGYLRGLIHSLANFDSPAEILTNLSSCLLQDPILETMIATLLVITMDNNNQLVLASAGHPQPILLGNNGYTYVDVHGGLLGLNAQTSYDETRLLLSPHERLVLYTDGLMEFGKTPLEKIQSRELMLNEINLSRHLDIETAGEAIISRFDKLSNAEPSDDTTLILLETHHRGQQHGDQ